jgi:predicted transcriptional regulator
MELSNFTFRMDPDMREWVKRRAEEQDRSDAYVVRAMLVKARAAIEEEEREDRSDA